jgi:hypothetical protein
MLKSNAPQIRAILRSCADGMTVAQIAMALQLPGKEAVRRSLANMPDVYIDRWEGPRQGQYAAVWCAVEVPENCPHPRKQNEQR